MPGGSHAECGAAVAVDHCLYVGAAELYRRHGLDRDVMHEVVVAS